MLEPEDKEESVWHDMFNDMSNDFVTQNALALSSLAIYHSQQGTDSNIK